MASGNGRRAEAWTWDEALCGVVPPLISPLNSSGQLVALAGGGRARGSTLVRRHADLLTR